jgi:hypothetical protein
LPLQAEAQVSIDQGKSTAEMFSLDCATCHKTARGLANGRNTSALATFLSEHYTSGKDQAASLAAYVMGAGGGDAVPASQRGVKPTPDRTRPEETKREPGKPEEGAAAKLQQNEEQKRLGDVPGTVQERGRKQRPEPSTASRGQRPETESRGQRPETESRGQRPETDVKPQPEPPREAPREAVAPSPAPAAAVQESSPAPAPTNAASGEGGTVPRDNIPD